MKQRTHGFTLIELLVGLALLTLVLTAALTINVNTSKAAAQLQSRNDLLPELQIAQNYMAGKLKEAAYIFPNGVYIQMASSGFTTVNPSNGSYNWRPATDPIVAFVLPPKTVVANACANATNAAAAEGVCYAFYAFYAIKRSDYIQVSGADNPGRSPDPTDDSPTITGANPGSLVLVEYRAYYSGFASNPKSPLGGYSTAVTEIPQGGSAKLLMDYLPVSAAASLFSTTNAQPIYTNQAPGSTSVTMNLASLQHAGGTTIRVPSNLNTDLATLTVYPRNVGKPQLNN